VFSYLPGPQNQVIFALESSSGYELANVRVVRSVTTFSYGAPWVCLHLRTTEPVNQDFQQRFQYRRAITQAKEISVKLSVVIKYEQTIVIGIGT
jgi:hypothetical protein